MKHQSSNLPKMKLNPLESATRTKDNEDGSILMVVNPTKEDWTELRNKYTSQRAFETRQVLTGMPLQQALLGLIFWLKSKNVYLKMSIASFAFRFDPFDIYYDWLQEYKAKHKITDVLKDMEDCRNANTTTRK